jgi:hypothetical protein
MPAGPAGTGVGVGVGTRVGVDVGVGVGCAGSVGVLWHADAATSNAMLAASMRSEPAIWHEVSIS